MANKDTSHFIKQRAEVAEADKTRTWTGAERPQGLEGPSIFLVGPTGAGKEALGKALARKLERPLVQAREAAQAVPGAINVLSPEAFEELGDGLAGQGPVFYLMATPGLLAQRLGVADQAGVRELSAALAEQEPGWLSRAHFILPAERSLEENFNDCLEKIALVGGRK